MDRDINHYKSGLIASTCMEKQILTLDVFTTIVGYGNPAGVCLDSIDPDDAQMQYIAAQMTLSETIFLSRIDGNEFRARYYTVQ